MLSAPRTLADIATDGFLAQADRLAMFRARFGEITKVEFSVRENSANDQDAMLADGRVRDQPVMLSFSSTQVAQRVELAAQWVATIVDATWHWQTTAVDDFSDIPQLDPLVPQPADDELLAATRTLFRNAPAVLVPLPRSSRRGSGKDSAAQFAVLIVSTFVDEGPVVHVALSNGLAQLPDHYDTLRALQAFAVVRGLEFEHATTEDASAYSTAEHSVANQPENTDTVVQIGAGDDAYTIHVRGGTAIDLAVQPFTRELSPTIDTLRAQGAALLRETTGHADNDENGENGENGDIDDDDDAAPSSTADRGVADRAVAAKPRHNTSPGWVVATVAGTTWTWAWADPKLAGTSGAQESRALLDFGISNGVLDFVRPHVDLQRADLLSRGDGHNEAIATMVAACAPITDFHDYRIDVLDAETVGIVLFSA
ncbi:hypothetical protein QP927_08355 [Corynebacterium pseudodiphtheriticum]|uniref:DUF6882 domain-containing protein n=1 Tax=Corynebacterium pseudodiphtheriticum TaxID=37637 RepID=UPI00254C4E35|nr:DUF6882 domain-containing protein [Corynebacterium pseudodiphtheriticum]MDK8478875.1 hypothetical protein [Corynebacterium pseudodiphtheriticum]